MGTVSAKSGVFEVVDQGPAHAEPIVFCHALGGTSAIWREVMKALVPRYRCIAYDASGHGGTPPRGLKPSIDAFADDLAMLMDTLGLDRVHIVGASIGGMVAQAFAASYPSRSNRLVLMATTPKMPDPAVWIDRAVEVRRDGLGGIAEAAMKRWFTPAFAAAEPTRIEETQEAFLATDIESYALACEAIAAMDLTGAIEGIGAPTLVMAAAADPSTPVEVAETLRNAIPGATSIIVPDTAHLMMIERPAEVAAWIQAFLGLPADKRLATT